MSSCLLNVIRDSFPKHRPWKFTICVAVAQFSIGLVYLTPVSFIFQNITTMVHEIFWFLFHYSFSQGGQYIMTFMDFFGASFVVICLAIAEILSLSWIYGVNRLCKDIEFMLGIKTGWYWRICWGVISPLIMIAILIFKAITLKPLKYHDYTYTDSFYCNDHFDFYDIGWNLRDFDFFLINLGVGWLIFALGVIQLPFWAFWAVYKQNDVTIRGVRIICHISAQAFTQLWTQLRVKGIKCREQQDIKMKTNSPRVRIIWRFFR